MVYVNRNDLGIILDHIRIAEQHAAGTPLTDLVLDPLRALGLRTVDGSFNNLTPGRENVGSADQTMPRLLESTFLTQPAEAQTAGLNPRTQQPTSYAQTSGAVYDAEPRIISNLVADQTLNNPAVIAAALKQSGLTGQALLDASEQISAAHRDLATARALATNFDAALAAQIAAAGVVVSSANAALASAATDVSAKTDARDAADAALVEADAALIAAGQTLIDMINAGDLATTGAALEAAEAQLALSQEALLLANQTLDGATAARDALADQHAAKLLEIATLTEARDVADAALIDATDALAVAEAALALEADLSAEITSATDAVAAARVLFDDATQAADSAAAALQAAQDDLARIEGLLATAEADVTAAETTLADAEATATQTQADLDAARDARVAAVAARDEANAAFTQAQLDLAAGTITRAEYTGIVRARADARTALTDATAVRDAAIAADNAADQAVIDAGLALQLAGAAATDLATQRDAATVTRDQRQADKDAADLALSEATAALDAAEAQLAEIEAANAGYAAAVAAVAAAADALAAATSAAEGAASNLATATDELSGIAGALAAAEDEVTAQAALAEAAAATAAADSEAEVVAQAAYDAAVAADVGIEQAELDLLAATDVAEAAAQAATAAAADLAAAITARDGAQTGYDEAVAALAALEEPGAAELVRSNAEAQAAEAALTLETLLATHAIEMDGNNVRLPDVAPDEGLSAPYNSWMSLFGQFFDHGLDLVGKGGSGTVYIPLQPDDPLYVEGSPTNFMVLTRATNQPGPDGVLGTADDVREHMNKTTPWVDQNQTYTSHPSHQVFLRSYELDGGRPVATGDLLHGVTGGMSTWGDVKAQAANLLGIRLNDLDVLDGPLLATDYYGNFIPGPNGLPQLVLANPDFGTVEGAPEHILVEGNLADPVDAGQALRNGHAFLEDIAHNAVPGTFVVDRFTGETAQKAADADSETGNAIAPNQFGQNETYDNELLDRHFIAGDGRGNENFGLTAVHHMFHSEHNRQVTEMKQTILESGEIAFINEWLRTPITEADLAAVTADDLSWNGERLFQSAKFATEMQYQHLAFEEFGRRIQPQIGVFMVNTSLEIDPAIFAEFAHVVYRFGHSMLTENVHTISADMQHEQTDLITAFLNPVAFDKDQTLTSDQAAAAVVRGMTRETGSNIDEFITSALRDNLVGLPLDLAALNIARGRDAGVPSLNEAREAFYKATGSEFLEPYTSWLDYAANLKNAASVVNFIAAYGTHPTIEAAETVEAKRAAATALVLGGDGAPADRLDFVRGTGAWATVETGINAVEFWIGGLAEKIMPFGGMLGSTFGFVFQHQMESLQNADRFYYLGRTNGMNMIGELENNSFASIIMKNTDIKDGGSHIPADIFAAMDVYLEVDQTYQMEPDPVSDEIDPFLGAMGTQMVERATGTADAPLTDGARDYDNFLKFNGGEHAVLGGTAQRDILVGGLGDDALWGGDGNDLLIGNSGVNTFRGGAGNDIIKDGDDISFLHGEDGDDVISAGGGIGELIFGGRGNDAIMVGADDGKHTFAGMGNDFVIGGSGTDVVDGGEGDDWIEGGDGFDFLFGDNNDNLGGSRVIGHDVLNGGPNDNDLHGESGDDILVQGEGTHVNLGELGYDWVAHKTMNAGAEIDLTKRIVPEQAEFFKDRYIDVEAVSGTSHDDRIWGDDRIGGDLPAGAAVLDNTATLFANELTQEGVDRITGLREFLGELMGTDPAEVFTGGNILLGGSGSDTIQGRGGDDVIDGDKYLNVRISIRDANDPTVEIRTIDSLREITAELLDGSISPSQLQIVREILDGGVEGDMDTAVYYDVRANYDIRTNADGSVTVQHINVTPGPNPIDPVNGRQNPIAGDGTDRLTSIETLRFADMDVDIRNSAGVLIDGTAAADNITGFIGNDVIFAAAGADTIDGREGDDLIFGEGGRDTIIWNVGGGLDIIDGGRGLDTLVANGDGSNETFRIYTAAAWTGAALDPVTEIVVTRQVGAGEEVRIAELSSIEEIVINAGGGNNTIQPIGDFTGTSLSFNTITVRGEDGDDNVDISELQSAHRIVLKAQGGNDVIVGQVREQDVIVLPEGTDITQLQRSEADGIVTLTDGDRTVRFTAAPGTEPGLVVAGTAAATQLIQAGTVDEVTGEFRLPTGLIALTQIDLDALRYMVTGEGEAPVLPPEDGTAPGEEDGADLIVGVRDLPGLDNNLVNPGFGAATEPFIRITEARYGTENPEIGNRDVNPIFDGLDPRDISNTLGAQEADAPKEASANMFLMSFGQYFDHGLTFIPKTTANGVIEIGGPGIGRAPGSDNPADLTRAKVVGFDENGVPQHENITSPFVDQNQVYGSSSLVGQLLRESDGNGGVGAKVLMGRPDPSNPEFPLLSTLRELLDHHIEAGTVFTGTDKGDATLLDYYPGLRAEDGSYDAGLVAALTADFMGEGWPLLIDTNPFINLLDHFVGGDGRANENVGLTAMHTVWARNHNYHVDLLGQSGFEGTPEEVFQAAKILNEAEYQQVVFNDFADALIGGLKGSGRHGHDKYNPEADARISHEFAGAVYRLGHSMIGQTLTILDADGQPKDVPLFDVFLNPTNDPTVFAVDPDGNGPAPTIMGAEAVGALAARGYVPQPGFAEYGAGAILAGMAQQPSEAVDFNIVDAVRNDLVRVSADLFSFNVARGWDLGIGTLNQVKMSLASSTDPYVSEAIALSDMAMVPYVSWEDFQTRNGLSDAVIAQFRQAYPDLVLEGDDIAAFRTANPDIALVDNGDGTMTVKGIDRVDLWVGGLAESHINGGIVGHTFWVVMHEQLDRLQEGDRFYYTDRVGGLPVYENFIGNITFGDIVARNTGLTGLPIDIFDHTSGAVADDVAPVTPEAPVTEEPAAETPATEELAVEAPATEELAAETPVTGEPAAETPATEELAVEAPAAEEPAVEAPATGEPATEEPQAPAQPAPVVPPAAPVAAAGALLFGTDAAEGLEGGAGDDNLFGQGGADGLVGGAGDDVLDGGAGDDLLNGGAGDDVVFGGDGGDNILGGTGDDMLFGEDGDDRIIAGEGNDMVEAGTGADAVQAGAGDDTFVTTAGDGDDAYFGDEGNDTLDMASILDNVVVDLGSGSGGRGFAISASGGTDSIRGIENVVTGAGDDVIVASAAVNVMDGGAGDDSFVFGSVEDADGDVILGFQPGDRIDLSGIDAMRDAADRQSFTLAANGGTGGAGELVISHESREDGTYTVVSGQTGETEEAGFRLSLKGHHSLGTDDFLL